MTNYEANKLNLGYADCKTIRKLRLGADNCPDDYTLCDGCFNANLNWLCEGFSEEKKVDELERIARDTDTLYDLWSTYGRQLSLKEICELLMRAGYDFEVLKGLLIKDDNI